MKVGIMSMQRIVNYGSFLQAYGLMKLIQQLGHDVEFVDYHPGESILKKTHSISVFGYPKKIVRFLRHRTTRKKRNFYRKANSFNYIYNEFLPLLGVTDEKNYDYSCDVLVIGSDEVFNCLQDAPVGFSPELFGYNCNAKRCISYAASFGTTTLEKLKEYGKNEEIGEYLSNLDSISVRDQNSESIIRSLCNKSVDMNLDPVLMYGFESEVPEISEKDYIIVYAYRGRISKEEGKYIKRFAKEKNKRLIALGGVQDFCDEYFIGNPFEILGYIKSADYIVTDTFHGAVFSLKYGKRF